MIPSRSPLHPPPIKCAPCVWPLMSFPRPAPETRSLVTGQTISVGTVKLGGKIAENKLIGIILTDTHSTQAHTRSHQKVTSFNFMSMEKEHFSSVNFAQPHAHADFTFYVLHIRNLFVRDKTAHRERTCLGEERSGPLHCCRSRLTSNTTQSYKSHNSPALSMSKLSPAFKVY